MSVKALCGRMAVFGIILGISGLSFAEGGGTISGKVRFKGTPRAPEKKAVTKDTAKCGSETVSEDLVVGPDNGVRWAVLSLNGAKAAGTKPAAGGVLDQNGCRFLPHVSVVPKGEEFSVLNSDGILHNVHTYSQKNAAVNKAQPAFKKEMKLSFGEPEIITLTCDVHSWMKGYLVVTDSPYVAVTDEAGSFKIPDVPPGTYKLDLWHESLGRQTKDVTVKAGDETQVSFELAASQ